MQLSLLSRTRADPSAAGGQAPLSASSAPPLIIPPQVVPPVASTPVTVESDIEKGKVMLERVSGQIDQDTATLHEWDQILQDYEFKRAQLKKRNDQNQVIQTDLTNQLNKLQGAADVSAKRVPTLKAARSIHFYVLHSFHVASFSASCDFTFSVLDYIFCAGLDSIW